MIDESTEQNNQGEDSGWKWDDNTPGVGDRPDYLQSKFKSVSEAVKSYNELEKKFGAAPKEYNLEAANWIDSGFEPLQEAAKLAKEKHVPQEVMDKILGATTQYIDQMRTNDDAAELGKLGADAKERISTLDNWSKSNFSKETYDALNQTMDTAASIVAMEEIRNKMLGQTTNVPGGTDSSSNNSVSVDDVQSELNQNFEKYKTDPNYRKEMAVKMELASRTSQFRDK